MWNFRKQKRLSVIVLLYAIAAGFYLWLIPHQLLTVPLVSTNTYLFILKTVLFLIYIDRDESIFNFQIYRFQSVSNLYQWEVKRFSIRNFLFLFGTALVEILILFAAQVSIDWLTMLLYNCFLFYAYGVIELYVLSGITRKKYSLRRYCIVTIFLFSFLLCIFNGNRPMTPINPMGLYFLICGQNPTSIIYFLSPILCGVIVLSLCFRKRRIAL